MNKNKQINFLICLLLTQKFVLIDNAPNTKYSQMDSKTNNLFENSSSSYLSLNQNCN